MPGIEFQNSQKAGKVVCDGLNKPLF